MVDWSTWVWASMWSYVFIAIFVIITIAITIFHIWEDHRYPKAAKNIKTAQLKNQALIDMASDDGYEDIVPARELIHEGILETKSLTKGSEPWVGFLPRAVDVESLEVGSGKDKQKTAQVIEWTAKMATRKLTLRGAKVPIWHAYRGKTVVLSLFGIVAIELLEELAKAFPSTFAVVDILAVKNYFGLPWDQTQRSAQGQRRENMGFKKGLRWGKQEGLKTIAMIFLIAAILLVFAVIILWMMK